MSQQYLNKKQELFCKFLAAGSTQLEAYELAGYEPSSANASTMANKPLIKARVAELRAEHERQEQEFKLLAMQAENADPELAQQIQKGVAWSFQRVMDMMAENVRLAQIAGEHKAANECLKMMGEAMSMFDKASTPKDDKGLPPGSPLTLIGQVTQILEQNGVQPESDNALAPRRKD